jgi:putative hydrolase of the HAD superfamily
MLRAVLFDLDNTLVDRDRAFRECVATRFPDPAVRAELIQLDGGARGDKAALFRRWEKHSGTGIDQAAFGQIIASRLKPDDELRTTLRALSVKTKTGIITNGNGQTQRAKLKASALDEVFSPRHIWVSGEVGIAKPDPAIFLLACEALGETPGDCLYVGDHEQDDLFGATRAGLRACLVDRPLDAAGLETLLNREFSR